MSLLDIATGAVEKAMARGATGVECTLSEGDEFSATVRMSEVETLKEAGSRAAGIRILFGQRVGSSYTSDLTPEGIAQMLDAAFQIGEITTEDPFAGLTPGCEIWAPWKVICALLAGHRNAFDFTEAPDLASADGGSRSQFRLRGSATPKAPRSIPSRDGMSLPIRWALPGNIAVVIARSA